MNQYYRDVLGLVDWEQHTEKRLLSQFERYAFECLQRQIGNVAGKRLLDVGCGWGGFILEVALHGAHTFGVEPDWERLRIAHDCCNSTPEADHPIMTLQAVGEHLPFPAECFDIVCCYQVLEHTTDPVATMFELVRVLKPDGALHIMAPNGLAFYESHYKVFWLPLMPKPLARIYLRLLGRDLAFIEHIRYITPFALKRILNRIGVSFVNVPAQNREKRLIRLLDNLQIQKRVGPGISIVLMKLCHPLIFMYVWLFHRNQELVVAKRNF